MKETASHIHETQPLSEAELEAALRIRWAHEAPHPDGGTQRVFGLLRTAIPFSGGEENIQLDGEGIPVRIATFDNPGIVGTDLNDEWSRLVYANFGLHGPIPVYLASPGVAISPLNPEGINEIGKFIGEVDRTFKQDDVSRSVLEVERGLLAKYRSHVESGALDENDEFFAELIRDASVHVELLEKSRKILPDRIRGLLPRAKELGLKLINERGSKTPIIFDPEVIAAFYTPDTDGMSSSEFDEHWRKISRDMPALRILADEE